jgi:hypothetical protein
MTITRSAQEEAARLYGHANLLRLDAQSADSEFDRIALILQAEDLEAKAKRLEDR